MNSLGNSPQTYWSNGADGYFRVNGARERISGGHREELLPFPLGRELDLCHFGNSFYLSALALVSSLFVCNEIWAWSPLDGLILV